jgi:opacity protein-like surface antigen
MFNLSPIFAQKDLDAVFYDGNKTKGFEIAIGTDVVTLMGGTVNIFGDLTFYNRFSVYSGIGIMPLKVVVDFSNSRFFSNPDDKNLITREITKPLYWNLGLKYMATRTQNPFFVYFEFKNWKWYSPIGMYYGQKYRNSKFNLGSGYTLNLSEKISCDAHLGIYIGNLKFKTVDNDGVEVNNEFYEENSNIYMGFDLGLNLKYKF